MPDPGVKMMNLVKGYFQNRQPAKDIGLPDGDFLWCIHGLQSMPTPNSRIRTDLGSRVLVALFNSSAGEAVVTMVGGLTRVMDG